MKRLYSLDAFRGLAALTIVMWHWQHFFAVSGTWQIPWQRDWQPFWWLLEPFYLQAWAAVDLFFALSGFVFFWLYAQAIRDGKIAPGKFALLRFSRLYPLQLLTLLVATGLQAMFHDSTGAYFIFPADDWQRFLAHFFMVHQLVPPNTDQTFNGPAWTVSIEAGLYVVFFLLCRIGLKGPRTAFIIALAAIPLFHWNWFISRGLMGFFLGGLAYYIVEWVRAHAKARRISQIICVGALALWAFVFVEILYAPLHNALSWISDNVPDEWDYYSENADDIFHISYIFTVVPLTIIALALSEAVLGLFAGAYRRISYLGDISYSVYMLHFPLQVACALLAVKIGLTPMDFMHDWVMLAFYAVLIGLASLSYFYYEKPMQAVFRSLPDRIAAMRSA
jgi:peptidoglycan/LPS O-acetylase OafA/YrhL